MIRFVYNESTATLQIDNSMGPNGEFVQTDLQGSDGIIHIVDAVPNIQSLDMNLYDVGKAMLFQEQMNLFDAIFLDSSLKQLTPLTVLFVPTEAFQDIRITLELIGDVLENHLFQNLLYCDTLLELASMNQILESENGDSWEIVVNEVGLPCFRPTGTPVGETVRVGCIILCDLWANNGVGHVVDVALLTVEQQGALTPAPTQAPTNTPTINETASPTAAQTTIPTHTPTGIPTKAPTLPPTGLPTTTPSVSPTTQSPTTSPVVTTPSPSAGNVTTTGSVGSSQNTTVATSHAIRVATMAPVVYFLFVCSAYMSVIL